MNEWQSPTKDLDLRISAELTQIDEDYMILEHGSVLPSGLIKLCRSSSSYSFNIAVPRGRSMIKRTPRIRMEELFHQGATCIQVD